jgi:glycosyltransferase involved in cell wall biosynthesis
MTTPDSDLIFVSMENWDDIWRRNQFVCSGLSSRRHDRKILFVGLPKDVTHSLRHGRMQSLMSKSSYTAPSYPNITILHPVKVMPNTLRVGRWINDSIARWQIRRAANTLALKDPVLWLNPHTAVHMVGRMGESSVVYDITDDWISLTQRDWLRALTAAQDAALCRKANAVIVCSQRLYDMKKDLSPCVHLIPNGVDAEHYRSVQDANLPLPLMARDWPKPVLGYTGSIHPDRVDIDLVVALAKRFSHGTIALVGPNMLRPCDEEKLKAHANIRVTGPVPYADVPDYMRAFDVCITPHRVTAFTESLNPIKLWEYLAAGKPIVSANVAGFRDYPTLVRIAEDATEFLNAADQALNEDGALIAERQSEARKHSWSARIDAVESILGFRIREREEVTSS